MEWVQVQARLLWWRLGYRLFPPAEVKTWPAVAVFNGGPAAGKRITVRIPFHAVSVPVVLNPGEAFANLSAGDDISELRGPEFGAFRYRIDRIEMVPEEEGSPA